MTLNYLYKLSRTVLLLLMCSVVFIACDEDDDPTPTLSVPSTYT